MNDKLNFVKDQYVLTISRLQRRLKYLNELRNKTDPNDNIIKELYKTDNKYEYYTKQMLDISVCIDALNYLLINTSEDIYKKGKIVKHIKIIEETIEVE